MEGPKFWKILDSRFDAESIYRSSQGENAISHDILIIFDKVMGVEGSIEISKSYEENV